MVNSNHDAMLMTELVPGYGELEVYVEHIVDEPVLNSDLEDGSYVDMKDVDVGVCDMHNREFDVDDEDEDDDDLYDRYTDMRDEEVTDQNVNNNDADKSDVDSWDSVEDVEKPEVIGDEILQSDYESEDLYNVEVVSNESEFESEFESDYDNADGDKAEVDNRACVDDRKLMVDSRRPIFPIFRTVASAKDLRFEIGMLFTLT
uniref:Uncharacterized protein n=1 Tax=Fagus sylvatica TaxID=28930 RepID=A0A2N9IP89_FAGSY